MDLVLILLLLIIITLVQRTGSMYSEDIELITKDIIAPKKIEVPKEDSAGEVSEHSTMSELAPDEVDIDSLVELFDRKEEE